jgi:hypothetical protein
MHNYEMLIGDEPKLKGTPLIVIGLRHKRGLATSQNKLKPMCKQMKQSLVNSGNLFIYL